MEEIYQPNLIEETSQKYWEEQQSYLATEDLCKEKYYCLSMFPYPSGKLHMGHVRNYTIGDVISRYQRMLGKNVLQPMGWDAFGLPAENAAIKHGVAPAKWTYDNIAYMRGQFKRLGFAYDWKREIMTCQPEYYRWEQWLFIKLFERGLAYKKNAVVNWDPVDQTVLANEQVVDGRGWRSGALIERREISQWFLKITDYAEQLLNDLEKLEYWPKEVVTMQRNWIGRSEGAEVYFNVDEMPPSKLSIYTTRPDTLFGVTYIAIAPEHDLAEIAARSNPELKAFLEECRHLQITEEVLATLEKRGMPTGFTAIHPITGARVPIWVANFVLMDYGTGAVMSVPAHDQRDFEFAQQYQLPIQPVINPSENTWDFSQAAYTGEGTLTNSENFDGLTTTDAKLKIISHLQQQGKGQRKINYRLRDWGVSRQRYWGTPVPMINCETCGTVPVPEDELPVVLPEDVEFTGATSPLKNIPEFYNVPCPRCKKPAHRETDTFDTFMESSWYYARFACKNQDQVMLDDRAKYWTPVDQYVGGIEHAVMHLLYARFFHKLLRDLGLVNSDEPFVRLLTQGMVLKDGSKMSKSKGNTVDPQALIEKFGADTVRLFTIFAAPPEQSLEWSDTGVEGAHRFLKRIWTFIYKNQNLIKSGVNQLRVTNANNFDWEQSPRESRDERRKIHEILKQTKYDFERLQFNTVVSSCMKLFNTLSELKLPDQNDTEINLSSPNVILLIEGLSILLRLLAPITPHIAHVLWRELGFDGLIIHAKWPKVAVEALKTSEVELVVQINGKRRGSVIAPMDANEINLQELIMQDEKLKPFLDNQPIKKFVVVPNKLINLVI